MRRKVAHSREPVDSLKKSQNFNRSSKRADSNNTKVVNPLRNSTQKFNSRYGQNDTNTNLKNSTNKQVKTTASNHIAITSIDIDYSKLVEEDKKKIDEIKDKLVRQKKLLEDKKKELNEVKEKNEKMKDNIFKKNKELETIKKEKKNFEDLNNNITNKINEITQTIEEQRQRQVNLLRRREMMMNYLMTMLMGLRRNDENYPNVDNMSYEELLALEERMGNVKKGLTKEEIDKLKKEKYVKNRFIDDKCIICQYEFKNYEKLILLPCKHCFHPDCITQWLENHKECPYCKTEVKV